MFHLIYIILQVKIKIINLNIKIMDKNLIKIKVLMKVFTKIKYNIILIEFLMIKIIKVN